MMMDFIYVWLEQFIALWRPGYLIVLGLALCFVVFLKKHSQGIVRFALLAWVLFVLFLTVEASLIVAGSSTAAQLSHYGALFVLGILTTRLLGLIFFRLLIPHFNLHPPRILEELLILLGYVGWTLYLLSDAGLELSSLITSTAVITAILAFAMQDTLGNILSGLALQLDQSICLGDWLEFEDMFGEVVQVQWRHTAIMTRFGEKILIPNSELMKNRVKIIGGQTLPGRYNTIYFYSGFEVSPTKVVDTIQSTLRKTLIHGSVPLRPPVCQVYNFEEGHITYALRFWVSDPRTIGAIRSTMWKHIYALFQRHGWYLSAPNLDLSIISQHKKTDLLSQTYRHSMEAKVSFLRSVGLFTALTDEEFELLAERLKTVFFVRGSKVIEQGDPGESMFIIVNGEAAIDIDAHGLLQRVAVLEAGEVFGEMSLMTGNPRHATVSAHNDLTCYELDKNSFSGILKKRPELAESLAKILNTRIEQLEAMQKKQPAANNISQEQRLLGNIRRWFGL